jgi:hypothetical protein
MTTDLNDLKAKLQDALEGARRQQEIDCELTLEGTETHLAGNAAALLQLAWRMVELAEVNRPGKHFTVDRADIAPDANCSLTVALKSYGQE